MAAISNETRLVIKLLKERAKTHREDEREIAKVMKKKEVTKSVEAYCDGIIWTESELDRIALELYEGR